MVDIYISQPMRGREHADILKERERIASVMAEQHKSSFGGIRIVPSYFGPKANSQMHPLECLGKSLELMAHADEIVFAPGWEQARGCRIEHECALQYGLRIVDLSNGQYERELS